MGSMNNDDEDGWVVKFVPFQSTVDSSFWVKYSQMKLDTIQLSEAPIDLVASYSADGSGGPRLQLQESSLDLEVPRKNRIPVKGILRGFNTIEAFQQVDKNEILRDFMNRLMEDDETKLTSFLVLTYADLKNHKVLYWFAMPALMPDSSIRATKQESLSNIWNANQRQQFQTQVQQLVGESPSCAPYFVYANEKCVPLSSYKDLDDATDVIFCFFDSSSEASHSTSEQQQHTPMGWPMRNLVAHLSIHFRLGGKTVRMLSYRPKRQHSAVDDNSNTSTSWLLHVVVPLYKDDNKVVGWELNTRNKPGPRWVNLRPLLDKQHLAIQASDLNLKLMKWRMIPSLDVEKLQSTKVLLIGAGTLGCSVARVLLGWGVRNIQFIDSGKVSYSNPSRQSLFTLEDCHSSCDGGAGGGGRPKAIAAAEALRTIVADVNSQGHVLSVPMPGHAESSVETSVTQLDSMVQECDVVFLLTDTRESRWLPTVMAAAHDKMLLNAALGLDSWLVIRHGGGSLGCYFCNDVVAPENSTKNRTLDQQCTVTRPGLAPIASSMAVELMVALLHHPLAQKAEAPKARQEFSPTTSDDVGALGVMPHQIRGSLVSYTMMTPTVPAFPYCTGCSPAVVDAYRNDKVQLVQSACESRDGSYLEDLSGLTTFRAEAAQKLVDIEDWEDDE